MLLFLALGTTRTSHVLSVHPSRLEGLLHYAVAKKGLAASRMGRRRRRGARYTSNPLIYPLERSTTGTCCGKKHKTLVPSLRVLRILRTGEVHHVRGGGPSVEIFRNPKLLVNTTSTAGNQHTALQKTSITPAEVLRRNSGILLRRTSFESGSAPSTTHPLSPGRPRKFENTYHIQAAQDPS